MAGLIRVLALMSLAALPIGEVALDVPLSPGQSPIEVVAEPQTKVPQIAASSATTFAQRTAGLQTMSTAPARFVRYADSSPFGPPNNGVGWLLSGAVQLSSNDAALEMNLNVIVDGNSGGIVVVYSDPRALWVTPVDEPRNPEIVTTRDGWVMGSSIPDSMESTAADAIAEAWKKFGLNPKDVGQVIARPRWISAQFPARLVDGELVRLRPTEKVWLVQVCGTKLNESESDGRVTYQTSTVMQFQDGSLAYMRGVFGP